MSRTNTRIGLLEHVGYGNLGDDATVAAVIRNIKSRWPDAVIIGLTLNPSDTQKQHGIASYAIRRDCKVRPVHSARENGKVALQIKLKAVLRAYPRLSLILRSIYAVTVRAPRAFFQELPFLLESFRITKSLDLLIISGGGQLRDSYLGPWKFPYTLFKWVILAKLSGARCYFVNVGAGPLETRLGRFLIKHALNLADYVSFRDEQSCRLIQRKGFTGKSFVHADCVYGLSIPPLDPMNRGALSREFLVGISPMQAVWQGNPHIYPNLIRELGLFGSWLLCGPHRLKLFGTDIWYDSIAVGDLQNAILNRSTMIDESRVLCPRIHGLEACLSEMSSMDYVVTCRFHGVVFAHLLNIPVVAISHHPKVATMMNDLGLSDYCLDIRTVTVDQIRKTFTRLVTNSTQIKSVMEERAAQYAMTLSLQFDSLFPRATAKDSATVMIERVTQPCSFPSR